MPKKKEFSLKEINYHIKDEANAVKEYSKPGLPKYLAKEEGHHLKYWQEQKKKLE